jgi:hypothetical protein
MATGPVYGAFGSLPGFDISSEIWVLNPSWPIQADYMAMGQSSVHDTSSVDDKELVADSCAF